MRPEGPVRVRWSEYDGDICYAVLGGSIRCGIMIVKHEGKYWFVGPERLGGIQEIPVDPSSPAPLTDALHFAVEILGEAGKMPEDLAGEMEGC